LASIAGTKGRPGSVVEAMAALPQAAGPGADHGRGALSPSLTDRAGAVAGIGLGGAADMV